MHASPSKPQDDNDNAGDTAAAWPQPFTIGSALALVRAALAVLPCSANPELEARIMVAAVCQTTELNLFFQQQQQLNGAQQQRLQSMLARRRHAEPLQYIVGTAGFYSMLLEVGPGVLIPRPETERLVELALERYSGHGAVCDLCTGTGAVALALARENPTIPMLVGVDISAVALNYAQRNRARYKLNQVEFLQADLTSALQSRQFFTLITANPPYVSAAEYAELPPEVAAYEPALALYAADNGLAVLRRIAAAAWPRLYPQAWLLCEIGATQGSAAQAILRQAGYNQVTVCQDYCQRDRVVLGQKA